MDIYSQVMKEGSTQHKTIAIPNVTVQKKCAKSSLLNDETVFKTVAFILFFI